MPWHLICQVSLLFFSKQNSSSLTNDRSRQSKLGNLPPQALKHLWIRTALMEKLLDKIVLYLVENSRYCYTSLNAFIHPSATVLRPYLVLMLRVFGVYIYMSLALEHFLLHSVSSFSPKRFSVTNDYFTDIRKNWRHLTFYFSTCSQTHTVQFCQLLLYIMVILQISSTAMIS